MNAYIISGGQGSQFSGIGLNLYKHLPQAKKMYELANDILGFRITDTIFKGTRTELKQTQIAQLSLFLYSTILALTSNEKREPSMIAGYSLGEYSALVISKILSFEDALLLMHKRANMMQKYCESINSGMLMIFDFNTVLIKEICDKIHKKTGEIVEIAIYGFPIVIGGTIKGLSFFKKQFSSKIHSKRMLDLEVIGAFHTTLMNPIHDELANMINPLAFKRPEFPFYQNIDGESHMDIDIIKQNLILELTTPIFWGRLINNMVKDGANFFIEFGSGSVLQNIVKNKVLISI